MLQAVIDTNILVRANIKATGSDFRIFQAFLDGKFELLYSEMLIREVGEVLNYPRIFTKYHLTQKIISKFIESIATFGKLVYSPKKVQICRDPEDDELFSIALAVAHKKPIYIVSGDKDVLSLKGKIKEISVLTAAEFLTKLSKQTN